MAHRKRRLDQLKHPFSPHREPFLSFFCQLITMNDKEKKNNEKNKDFANQFRTFIKKLKKKNIYYEDYKRV